MLFHCLISPFLCFLFYFSYAVDSPSHFFGHPRPVFREYFLEAFAPFVFCVVEERENRQEQRTQKRNLHRENISQKKQELQKAQEARQNVHANGSATAGATRSHERPVATPVPKPAPTDTVTKPDMKRPATSPVIKNAEVKAGKETVRTNIRQEQQVKGVTRTNQPNVAKSRSNQKKTTIQKQVNQKQNRKTVTKQPEKERKK